MQIVAHLLLCAEFGFIFGESGDRGTLILRSRAIRRLAVYLITTTD